MQPNNAAWAPMNTFWSSLKTVELENGQEKLKNYNLHLFHRWNYCFIEDGVVQPPGRARIIEGMRGAVGFGVSPNCSFTHVSAEFQIELIQPPEATSYSPDPLFWSSVTPPSPPPPPPAAPGASNNRPADYSFERAD